MSPEIKCREQMKKRLQDEFLINVDALSKTLGTTENRLLDNFLRGLILVFSYSNNDHARLETIYSYCKGFANWSNCEIDAFILNEVKEGNFILTQNMIFDITDMI